MVELSKGMKVNVSAPTYAVRASTSGPAHDVDLMAVLLDPTGRVRNDDAFVFFNNPRHGGVAITGQDAIAVDLDHVPAEVDRVLIAASTEAQGMRFGQVSGLTIGIDSPTESFAFTPPALTSESVLMLVAFYRRDGRWKLDAIGQGYADGLAAFATDFGISVDDAAESAPAVPAPTPAAPAIDLTKVSVRLTKDSADKTATIDLRKSMGDPGWVLTVGLEWDGRGAVYDRNGSVQRYGTGDLDVYFFCRNEDTDDFVVISGDRGHEGSLTTWPFIHHYGDSAGPGGGGKPAVEQVRVLPNENGDLLVNIYQSVDNGAGAIDTFGQPRCVIRYGRAAADGLPGPDADEISAYVGNSKDSYWATVAHIDVQDGVLTVDGETRYSKRGSERMPGLDTAGTWVREPDDGPIGQSKNANGGQGLTHYAGRCQRAKKVRR